MSSNATNTSSDSPGSTQSRAEVLYYSYLLVSRRKRAGRAEKLTESEKADEANNHTPGTRMDAWLQTVRWLAEPGLMPRYARECARRFAEKQSGTLRGSSLRNEVAKRISNPQPADFDWLIKELGLIALVREPGDGA